MFSRLRSAQDRVGAHARPRTVEWALRILVLAFCIVVSAVLGHLLPALGWTVLLLVVALLTLRPAHGGRLAVGLRLLEAVLGGVAVLGTGGADSPYLLYLIVPVVAAGLWTSQLLALVTVAVGALAFVAVSIGSGQILQEQYVQRGAQYILVALVLGPMAAWARRALLPREEDEQPLYDAAYRLLSQLRTVTRRLPGTLDPVMVTAELLDRAEDVLPAGRSGVLVRGGDARLTPVSGSRSGLEGLGDIALSDDSAYAEAWTSQLPQTERRGESWLLVLPLVFGVRTCGLLVLEPGAGEQPSAEQVAALSELCGATALRLETALLFADVRELATAEERQRVAREIHDGIAQELVIVGYGIDNALADLDDEPATARETLRTLRGEVTRIITELRLSLFDLRSDVEPGGGLGTAITAYLRGVGTTSGLTVHITMDESAQRLPSGTEVELLRIVQEAVTNARKHSGAANLWITCDVHPPRAHLRVEDDGSGIVSGGRQDSFGMRTMRERAERLHASLEIGNRPAGGTVVEVQLDGAPSGRGAPGRSLRRPAAVPGEGRA